MSNRRHPSAAVPPDTAAYARSYRCTDCQSKVGRPRQDQYGFWHVTVHHDDSCPVLNRKVSGLEASLTAALRMLDDEEAS